MISLNKQSAIPIYRQLADVLRSQVLKGELKSGDQLPSEFDLVEKYAVSRSSVRHAIDLLVREGLVIRMQGKGNFIVDWRNSQNHGGIIALLVPDTRLFLFMNVLNGVESAAKSRDHLLAFSYLGKDYSEEKHTFQRLRDQNVGGFIIFPRNYELYDEAIWQLYQDGFPFILIDRHFPDLPSAFVGVDNFQSSYNIAEYLIGLGHRSIGFASLADLNTTTIRDRYAGFRKGISDHGIDFNEGWLFQSPALSSSPVNTEEDEIVTIDCYRRLFRQGKLPSAIFAINDGVAYLVYRAARAEGIRIPEDLSLVGFDDDEYARGLEVPLTTMAQPWYDMGARAAHLLIDRLRGAGSGLPLERVLLPTHLVIRQSCGEPVKIRG